MLAVLIFIFCGFFFFVCVCVLTNGGPKHSILILVLVWHHFYRVVSFVTSGSFELCASNNTTDGKVQKRQAGL